MSHIAVTASTDKYGDTTTSEASPVLLPGVVFAPRSSTEGTDPRTPSVIVGGTLYGVPAARNVTPLDRFVVDGVKYEVEGEPGHWRSPFTGRDYGLEVPLKRYEQP